MGNQTFTVAEDIQTVGRIEQWVWGHPVKQRYVVKASMPSRPGQWGWGWIDAFETHESVDGAIAIAADLTSGKPEPITERRYGFFRWCRRTTP